MEAYAEGEPCDELIIRAYLAPPPRVVFESPAQPEASLVNILEKTALRHIEDDLCLLNPSMGTVWRAIDEGKYFSVAYTEGSQNDENRKRFESTFSELIRDQKNEYIPELKKEQVSPDVHYFCGMSGVHKWVVNGSGFDPNIFDPQFIAASVTSMEEYSDGVHLRHWRKDYETIRDWVYHPHYYRYSASGFMARMGRDYKDSNYYQNELTSYLDRFFYCSTRVLPSVSVPFSPTPCGKVFFFLLLSPFVCGGKGTNVTRCINMLSLVFVTWCGWIWGTLTTHRVVICRTCQRHYLFSYGTLLVFRILSLLCTRYPPRLQL